MCYSGLDFRYGWRWLLPLVAGQSVGLYGFSREEELFWNDVVMTAGLVGHVDNAEVLLVNADGVAKYGSPVIADIDIAQVVCVVASGQLARRWRRVLRAKFSQLKEYSLLPAANPRIVVPLDSSRHAASGLSLHRPGRWTVRLGLLAARALVKVGCFGLLRRRVLLIATRAPDSLPLGALQAEFYKRYHHQGMDFALYLGTADDNRKTVVLPVGPSVPQIILKIAATPRARASLTNEAAALVALAQSPLAMCVPQLSGLVASGSTLNLYQEFRQRRFVGKRRMGAAVVHFLAQLSQVDRELAPLSELLAKLPLLPLVDELDGYAVAYCAVRRQLEALAASGAKLWVHRAHGDFSPWNCAWSDHGIFVFDWEESRRQSLALGDAFSYVISPAHLIQRKANAHTILSDTLSLAERVVHAGGLAGLDARDYLALWLLHRDCHARLYGDLLVLLERNWR